MEMFDKTKIVIDNYFKVDCSVNTSIKEAYEKGFYRGAKKSTTTKNNVQEVIDGNV